MNICKYFPIIAAVMIFSSSSYAHQRPNYVNHYDPNDIVYPKPVPINFDANLLNIQERLSVLGYYPTYLVDGTKRKEMKSAIMNFQRDYNLDVDGIFGVKTAAKLNYYTGSYQMRPSYRYETIYYYAPPHIYYQGSQ